MPTTRPERQKMWCCGTFFMAPRAPVVSMQYPLPSVSCARRHLEVRSVEHQFHDLRLPRGDWRGSTMHGLRECLVTSKPTRSDSHLFHEMHLQPLTPATLEPSWHSPAALVAFNLRKIGSVSVSLQKDATSPVNGFSISILPSAPTASRIPSAANSDEHSVPVWNPSTHSATCCVQDSGGRLPASQPQYKQDAAVVSMPFKRLEDFNELRSKVYNLAISLHAFGSTCEYCEAALTCVLWGRGQYYQKQRDALLRMVNDEQRLLETLATIVRNLVVLGTSKDIRVSCRMELELPEIIHNFLFGEAQRK